MNGTSFHSETGIAADGEIEVLVNPTFNAGTVGAHFCSRLAEQKLTDQYQVTFYGREPIPAYNRIHLSTYVGSRNATALELKSAAWYQDNNIELKVGTPGEELNTSKRKIVTADGSEANYDTLVFATGSVPFAPDGLATGGPRIGSREKIVPRGLLPLP